MDEWGDVVGWRVGACLVSLSVIEHDPLPFSPCGGLTCHSQVYCDVPYLLRQYPQFDPSNYPHPDSHCPQEQSTLTLN